MDIKTALSSASGAARWHTLRDAGVTRREVVRAVESGLVLHPSRGTYALPGTPWPVIIAASQSAALACVSAAEFYGLWVWQHPRDPHLILSRQKTEKSYTAHRCNSRARGVVPLLECLAQCLQCLPQLEALCVVESAVVLGHVSIPEIWAQVKGKGSVRAREIVRRIDPKSQSLIETITRETLRNAGLQVQSQVRFDGVGHVDLLVNGVLVVELDGRKYHSSDDAFTEDRRRWNALTTLGIPVLRFPAAQILRDPQSVMGEIRATLARLQTRPHT